MGPIWDPSGQSAYGLTHMGPMRNPVVLPIWVPYGKPIWDPYRHLSWDRNHWPVKCILHFAKLHIISSNRY